MAVDSWENANSCKERTTERTEQETRWREEGQLAALWWHEENFSTFPKWNSYEDIQVEVDIIVVVKIAIDGFQSRDRTAMLMHKTIAN